MAAVARGRRLAGATRPWPDPAAAVLADAAFDGRMARVTGEDNVVPLGDAAAAVLLSRSAIESAARPLAR